jgi:hypothetical protein
VLRVARDARSADAFRFAPKVVVLPVPLEMCDQKKAAHRSSARIAPEEQSRQERRELVVTQGHHGIEAQRAPGGEVGRGQRCGYENNGGDAEAKGVG